jgi:hypothetical protein
LVQVHEGQGHSDFESVNHHLFPNNVRTIGQ